ncbi:MAG: metallophosphoesterase family protein [bacterium]
MNSKDVKEQQGISRREFIAGAAAVGASLLFSKSAFGLMSPIPKDAMAEVLSLKASPGGTFRILVVTDLHFYANHLVDAETVRDIKNMVRKFKPDLIIPTGDNWHNNPGGHGIEFCEYACEQMGKMKAPWAFVWGNHDQVDDYDMAHKMIREANNSLYRGGAADGNYRLELKDASGEKTLWNLIMLNDSRGGMRDEQIDWLKKEAAAIKSASLQPPPAFLFFHIPIKQYDDLAKSGHAKGMKMENVSYDESINNALSAFSETGFVKAAFCGHDHVNNYWGVQGGVFLEYARATGSGGYGHDRCKKGGTIIDMNTATGEFKTTTVFADGSTWEPKVFIG